MLVMFFGGISMLTLATSLKWASGSASLNEKNNRVFTAAAAAEAASEKALAKLSADYAIGGETTIYDNLANDRYLIPDTSESSYWTNFTFSNGSGTYGQIYVDRAKSMSYTDLYSQYAGLKGFASSYRIIANARETMTGTKAAVCQDLQMASIPVFQFAIFYGLDLELHSMTTMNVIGRVHGNSTNWTYPSATLTFYSDVTAVGQMIKTRKPGDPSYSSSPPSGSIVYKAAKDSGVSSLILPIGTNNAPTNIWQVLDLPPGGEDINSPMGRQRYYNKAELVIVVGNTSVTAFAKAPFSSTTYSIPFTNITKLISTNLNFVDQRENKRIRVVELDVSSIQSWSYTNSAVSNAIGTNTAVNLIYIADQRTWTGTTNLNGVRLISGQTLPARGLTVATPHPLYVKGHFNQPTAAHLGTTNTTNAKGASLVSDALTILSSSWLDSASAASYTTRDAVDTTVNAAILTGIVETSTAGGGRYSGGAHNLGRFLEDWSGRTFTCNGSMVVLFPSQRAIGVFQQPGAYYNPPARNFAFDLNYQDITKQPPGTPEVRAMIRNAWATIPPDTTNWPLPN